MMFPLRTSESISRLPLLTPVLMVIVFGFSVLAYSQGDTHLVNWALNDGSWGVQKIFGLFVFPTVVGLFFSLLYLWTFSPRVFLNRSLLTITVGVGVGLVLCFKTFKGLQNNSSVVFFLGDAIVGVLLGMFMRGDIWGQVSALVVGWGWIRVYDVPSYVLLFFWFFYQLLGALLLPEPFSELRMIYWVPFVSFTWGFLFETIIRSLEVYANRAAAVK
jgi:hypothetical protein